jgi:hypothetical protein
MAAVLRWWCFLVDGYFKGICIDPTIGLIRVDAIQGLRVRLVRKGVGYCQHVSTFMVASASSVGTALSRNLTNIDPEVL